MTSASPAERIRRAFAAVRRAHAEAKAEGGAVEARRKTDGSPVTDADLLFNRLLAEKCCAEGDAWLSEEAPAPDSPADGGFTWVVDPIDGTKEYATGVPEWAVSVAAVRDGRFHAAGVFGPEADLELVWEAGGELLADAPPKGTLLVSRSEIGKGLWENFPSQSFTIKPCGSIAYKLGLVAAGRFAATATIRPKNAWDIAAGVALVEAAGGAVRLLDGGALEPQALAEGCNVRGLVAVARGAGDSLEELRAAALATQG